MARRIRRHREVENDILDNAAHIARDSLAAGLRFLDAVEQTLERLADYPELGRLRDFDDPRLAAVRSLSVRRFRSFLIFYEVEADGIYVLAIIHGARDFPAALARRLT